MQAVGQAGHYPRKKKPACAKQSTPWPSVTWRIFKLTIMLARSALPCLGIAEVSGMHRRWQPCLNSASKVSQIPSFPLDGIFWAKALEHQVNDEAFLIIHRMIRE